MKDIGEQGELLSLVMERRHPFRLRANDIIRIDGKLCRIIRVNECAAVVLMNRGTREFSTRFDKRVRIKQPPVTFRISANSEVEIVNRKARKKRKQNETERRVT
ncbi:MAG: hypothetical protein ABSE16_06840 [Verrucomicrobiota bacterium]|jgi:hypothetical protein